MNPRNAAAGKLVYKTVAHDARCEDCAWRGRPIAAGDVAATTYKPSAIRNVQAARHARVFGHKVVVVIHREFDRRPAAAP
jgi:hypothetical protein